MNSVLRVAIRVLYAASTSSGLPTSDEIAVLERFSDVEGLPADLALNVIQREVERRTEMAAMKARFLKERRIA